MVYSKSRLAWRQFTALCRKNWIVLGRHWMYNLARCLLVPIAFAFFMAKASVFFAPHNELGLGSPVPIRSLDYDLLGLKLVWSPPKAALFDPAVDAYADEFMGRALQGVNPARVQKVYNSSLIQDQCPSNYALRSGCYGAVVLTSLVEGSNSFVYTLRGDGGNVKVNVKSHDGDLETRFLPLQWALDSTFIEMRSGYAAPLPNEWPYTRQSNAQQAESNRQGYLGGILSLIVLALYLNFLGVVYHLPGAIASERSAQLTSHMEAMGLLRRAKVLSWHVSLSAAYLPAWIITAVVWRTYIWTRTSFGLLIVFFILIGLANASWTFLVAAPFHKLPTLAAIAAVFLAIVFNIVALISSGASSSIILSVVFPPAIFTFVVKEITRQERRGRGAGWLAHSTASPFPLVVYLVILVFDIVAFPLLAVWLEKRLYGVRRPGSRGWFRRLFRRKSDAVDNAEESLPGDVAVRLTDISKVFVSRPWWSCGQRVKRHVAIESLSMDFSKGDINVLLGRNGASKSTTISILSGLLGADGGSVAYSSEASRIGIAPQQNVLWNELSCRQHIRLWMAIKARDKADLEVVDDVLDRADLSRKKADLASNLSGGQKRKLQLAAAIAARSKLIVLDECTTGVDPLSRHALWKTILSCRQRSTVILTTHFLDEADILGDRVSMLRAPGRLLGNASPTAWKTGSHGHGYAVGVTSTDLGHDLTLSLTSWIAPVQTLATVSQIKPGEYLIRPVLSETAVSQVLDAIARHDADLQLDVHATSLEEVFMQVTTDRPVSMPSTEQTFVIDTDITKEKDASLTTDSLATPVPEKDFQFHGGFAQSQAPLTLTAGRHISPARQAWIITHKRFLTLRQTYLMPLIGVLMLCCGVLIPIVFLQNGYNQTCERIFEVATEVPLTKPFSVFARSIAIAAPRSALTNIPAQVGFLPQGNVTYLSDEQSFNNYIRANYTRTRYGGVYLDDQNNAQIAYEARQLTNTGISVLNLATNSIMNRAANTQGYNIVTSFSYFAALDFSSTGQGIKYVAFFSLAYACFVAFFTLAPTNERRLSVKGNLFANGVTPVSYWLGQLLADAVVFSLAVAIVTIGLAATVKRDLSGIGLLWLCMELYCVAGALFAYVFSLFLESSLAAWALCAAWNVIWFLLYIAADLLLLTFDKTASATQHLTVVYFAMGIVSPVIPLIRSVLVSLGMFSLLCDGLGNRSKAGYGAMAQFGGPILYLFLWILILFGVLVWFDSGKPFPRLRRNNIHPEAFLDGSVGGDVAAEAQAVIDSNASLRVLGLVKAYNKRAIAVKNVSFQVHTGQTFALIGPNGAGKTSALSCIQGSLAPSHGDVYLHGKSITHEKNQARASIGICPQINPFDDLSVEEHLEIYGRLKGLTKRQLRSDVGILLDRTGLRQYQHLRAGALSGGNKRKLCLALALIGSPGILSVDEFSSGVDSYARRENYALLRSMSADKAVIFTTHSMEEVENMADRVGVLAGSLLAIGSVGDLKRRYQAFEIHLTSDQTEACLAYVQRAFPGSRRMLDTASRFEVPVADGSIAELFRVMAAAKAELGIDELAVQRLSMESTFIKIIQQHGVKEENEGDEEPRARRRRWFRRSH